MRVLFSNRMLDRLTAELGTKLGKAPEGYVHPVGRRKTLFDEDGNPSSGRLYKDMTVMLFPQRLRGYSISSCG